MPLKGVSLSVSTLADYVGHSTILLQRIIDLIEAHVLSGPRIHHDDTTVPVIAAGKTITGRIWTSVRDDRLKWSGFSDRLAAKISSPP